jgi:hypothetical protein
MIRIIKRLLGLCNHEWEDIYHKKVKAYIDDSDKPCYVELVFIFRCKKCGTLKKKTIRY